MVALRTLFSFMDVMRAACDAQTLQIFSLALNFHPLCTDECAGTVLPSFPPTAAGLLSVHANSPPSAEDTLARAGGDGLAKTGVLRRSGSEGRGLLLQWRHTADLPHDAQGRRRAPGEGRRNGR